MRRWFNSERPEKHAVTARIFDDWSNNS